MPVKNPRAEELVAADQLLASGKLRGELIVVRAALEKDPENPRLLKRLQELSSLTDPQRLIEAARAAKPTTLKKLLLQGVDANPAATDTSPLGEAASRARVEAVELLLEHGADPKRINRWGSSPLHLALMARPNINDRELEQRCRIAALLVAANADLAARDQNGRTPFWHACNLARGKATTLVEQLSKRGPDLLAKDDEDFSILHLSARWNHLEVLQAALAAGADVQAFYGANEGTALTLALHGGHSQAAELLLAAGANPNVRVAERTPLATAAFARDLSMVKLLRARGADPTWLLRELESDRLTAIKGKWREELRAALS